MSMALLTSAVRAKAPIMAFSSTVIVRIGRTIWKVRIRPFIAICSGGNPAMISPPSITLPAVGRNAPEIILKHVVLPAPLGPIKATISLSATSNETSLTAVRPRNDLVRARTWSIRRDA